MFPKFTVIDMICIMLNRRLKVVSVGDFNVVLQMLISAAMKNYVDNVSRAEIIVLEKLGEKLPIFFI